jgi:hypothetical protein
MRDRRRPVPGPLPGARQEDRRLGSSGVVAAGSLACARCDAPVSIGATPLSPAQMLVCPFCEHRAPLREFLSLALPTRPARVVVRLRVRG